MKNKPQIVIAIVAVAAVLVGLLIGLGAGQLQLKKEQKAFQDKLKDAQKKVVFIQKRMSDEKSEIAASAQRQYQADMEKLGAEKSALGAQAVKLKEQIAASDASIREAENASAKVKKELQDVKQKQVQSVAQIKDMERDLKKMTAEKNSIQAELKKTEQNLTRCETNNKKLTGIADDLLKAYRNKGVGTALLEKEPLTQVKKVEMEQLLQTYRDDIEQQKFKKR